MGGDLTKGHSGKAPSFVIRAVRDPDNANLDRAQVIKGWPDKSGKTHERIYDAKFFNVKMPDDVPMTVQDRAYTSPIWYTP